MAHVLSDYQRLTDLLTYELSDACTMITGMPRAAIVAAAASLVRVRVRVRVRARARARARVRYAAASLAARPPVTSCAAVLVAIWVGEIGVRLRFRVKG